MNKKSFMIIFGIALLVLLVIFIYLKLAVKSINKPSIIPAKHVLIKADSYKWSDWGKLENRNKTLETKYFLLKDGGSFLLSVNTPSHMTKSKFKISNIRDNQVTLTPPNKSMLYDTEHKMNEGLQETQIEQGHTWILESLSNDAGYGYRITVLKINNSDKIINSD